MTETLKIKQFRIHVATVANGGAALAQNSVVKAMNLPANAVIFDIQAKWAAGGGTNTFSILQTKQSDGTTIATIKSGLAGGTAGFWRMCDEAAAAAVTLVASTVPYRIDISFTGANGWPVDVVMEGYVLYFVPTFDDEFTDVTIPGV